MTESVFCGACGGSVADDPHERCARLLRYDPPRFCTDCGFRLDVQVYPSGVVSRCRRCTGGSARNAP